MKCRISPLTPYYESECSQGPSKVPMQTVDTFNPTMQIPSKRLIQSVQMNLRKHLPPRVIAIHAPTLYVTRFLTSQHHQPGLSRKFLMYTALTRSIDNDRSWTGRRASSLTKRIFRVWTALTRLRCLIRSIQLNFNLTT